MSKLLQIDPHSLTRLCELVEVLKRRAPIGVIYSGDPDSDTAIVQRTANSRSWKSYKNVAEQIAEALTRAGFAFVDIVSEGEQLQSAVARQTYQLYWMNTGGMQGRDSIGHAPAYLENLGIPYLGHSPLQAALLDDKVAFKQWLRGIGLPTAPFIVRGANFSTTIETKQSDFQQEFGFAYQGPFLVKPANGRGSIDIEIAETLSQAVDAVRAVSQKTGSKVVVEKFLAGAEYCVWGARGIRVQHLEPVSWQNTTAFGASERLYSISHRVYRKDENLRVVDPARLLEDRDETVRDGLRYLGKSVFSYLGLATPVRIDARRDQGGLLSILEVNPKPDFSQPIDGEVGLLAAALQDLECSYDDFILKIVFDWLDFYLRYYPQHLAFIAPLFERYAPQALSGTPASRRHAHS